MMYAGRTPPWPRQITIEARQGLKIACIEEVSYRMGFSDAVGLRTLVEPLRNDYGRYLLEVLAE